MARCAAGVSTLGAKFRLEVVRNKIKTTRPPGHHEKGWEKKAQKAQDSNPRSESAETIAGRTQRGVRVGSMGTLVAFEDVKTVRMRSTGYLV